MQYRVHVCHLFGARLRDSRSLKQDANISPSLSTNSPRPTPQRSAVQGHIDIIARGWLCMWSRRGVLVPTWSVGGGFLDVEATAADALLAGHVRVAVPAGGADRPGPPLRRLLPLLLEVGVEALVVERLDGQRVGPRAPAARPGRRPWGPRVRGREPGHLRDQAGPALLRRAPLLVHTAPTHTRTHTQFASVRTVIFSSSSFFTPIFILGLRLSACISAVCVCNSSGHGGWIWLGFRGMWHTQKKCRWFSRKYSWCGLHIQFLREVVFDECWI